MPFKKDHETLEKLFARALKSQEIRDGIASSDLGNDYFRTQLSKRAEKVWSSAAEELARQSGIEESLKAAQSRYEQAVPGPSSLFSWLGEAIPTTFGLLLLGVMTAGVISFFSGFKTVFGKLLLPPWS